MKPSAVEQLAKKFGSLQTWDDILVRGADIRQNRDSWSFELGDLALYACPHNALGGRPEDGQRTLGSLAKAWGISRGKLSALYGNSYFWPIDVRITLPPNVSWDNLSEARRRSGWRVGTEPTAKQKEWALELVYKMADGDQIEPTKKHGDCTCPKCGKVHEQAKEKAGK